MIIIALHAIVFIGFIFWGLFQALRWIAGFNPARMLTPVGLTITAGKYVLGAKVVGLLLLAIAFI